jgi:hypothetical protein
MNTEIIHPTQELSGIPGSCEQNLIGLVFVKKVVVVYVFRA